MGLVTVDDQDIRHGVLNLSSLPPLARPSLAFRTQMRDKVTKINQYTFSNL